MTTLTAVADAFDAPDQLVTDAACIAAAAAGLRLAVQAQDWSRAAGDLTAIGAVLAVARARLELITHPGRGLPL